MTPEQRSKWCIAQAEQIESELPPLAEGETLKPIAYLVADWYRDMAFRVASQHGSGHA